LQPVRYIVKSLEDFLYYQLKLRIVL